MKMLATRLPLAPLLFVSVGGCNPPPNPSPNPLDGCGWNEEETEGDLEQTQSREFQDYVVQHVRQREEGGWVVEGDILIDDFKTLVSHYQRGLLSTDGESSDSDFRSTAFCGLDGGPIDVIWNPAEKLAITYCLDSSWVSVPDYRDLVEEHLAQAALAWESAADVNFIQLAGGVECSHENGVVYEVRYNPSDLNDTSGTYAQASFPNADEHVLDVWTRAFGPNAAFSLDFLFVHELGHSLGLYHEHARYPLQNGIGCLLSAGSQSWWRGLTAPDPDSVMGYPQCMGPSPLPPHPSALDRTGLGFLYNLPRPVLAGPMGQDAGTLIWHRPSNSDYVVWTPVGEGNQPLTFSESGGCYEPECEASESSEHWKPLLYQSAPSVDVLMFGPGPHEERRLRRLDDALESESLQAIPSHTDVPLILDRFFDGSDRSVWWIRPGVPSDSLWRDLDDSAQLAPGHDAPPFTDEHYTPVVGRLFGNRSSVFWLSPTRLAAYLSYWDNGTLVQVGVSKPTCGLGSGVRYNAVPGDFDHDGLDEILWYDFDSGRAWYWPELPQCAQYKEMNLGQAKLSAFSLDGNTEVLMVYRPQGAGVVQFVSVPDGNLLAVLPQPIDASPVVRDFDTDGCTDVLWFTPHRPTSALWHSTCNLTFRPSLVQHPAGAYPLGYGLGHGRR